MCRLSLARSFYCRIRIRYAVKSDTEVLRGCFTGVRKNSGEEEEIMETALALLDVAKDMG